MTTKPRVRLVGEDGNAWAILGRCHRAAKQAGWTKDQLDAFTKEATSGDYNHLLRTVCDHFEEVDDIDDVDDDECN